MPEPAGGFLDIFGYPFCRGRIFNEIEQDNGQYDDASRGFLGYRCMHVRIRSSALRQSRGFDEPFLCSYGRNRPLLETSKIWAKENCCVPQFDSVIIWEGALFLNQTHEKHILISATAYG
jgi:hypothetical protein